MNRRLFLSALAAAIADPERLLWTPGRKLISIPKPRVLEPGDRITMASTLSINSAGIGMLKIGDTFDVTIETGPSYEMPPRLIRRTYVVREIVGGDTISIVPATFMGRPLRRRRR